VESGVLTKAKITRMAEAELTSDILAALVDGIQSNKNIERYYELYEDEPGAIDKWADAFDKIMSYLGEVYAPAELANTNWSRIHLFYSLFLAIGHGLYGVKGIRVKQPSLTKSNTGKVRARLDEISAKFDD